MRQHSVRGPAALIVAVRWQWQNWPRLAPTGQMHSSKTGWAPLQD